MKKYFPSSELIINEDGSVFHLHVKPEWLADKVILVGDPGRVALVASHFENKECEVESREFKTITGTYKGKRITVVSTGIGCDNIDIVMNELDALANIDFNTREEKDQFRQLELVRIGTCGGLQPNTPVGTFVCSQKSIGFDGLLNFYAGRNAVCDLPFERAFLNHMGWSGNMCAPAPYVIDASEELIDRIAKEDMADVLEVTVKDGNKTLYSGTPTQLENTQAADDLLAVGQRRTLTMYFHFPEATGNSAQAKDLTFTLCADATQTKNNPQRLFD